VHSKISIEVNRDLEQSKEKSFEKRQELINAAINEFSDKGYDNASLNNILKRTGISKGTFYYHFANKEDLYFYLVSLLVEEKIKEAGFMDMVHSKTGYRNISVISLNEKDHENSAKLINDYALTNDADLIVVLKENKNFFSRLLKPSATKKIIKEARLPVLVYYY